MSMALNKRAIGDVDVKGKRVLMRVDFNVPQDKTGAITNTQRIVGAMPTIKVALEKGAKAVILMSHLGRPDGKPTPSMTLKPVADKLSELMGKPVTFLPDCVGAEVESACANPAEGSIIVLENLRFHVEEEGKGVDSEGKKTKASAEETAAFRASLGKLGDVYVNDAFGTAHRAHSSMVGVQGLMPCVAGLLVNKELEAFSQVLDPQKVQRPLTAIVGGAKIADKVLVIENLIDKADKLILCGGMAYTFMKVCFGMEIGKSLFDKNGAELAPKLMEKAKAKGVEIVLPVDWACGQEFKDDQPIKMVTKAEGIPEGWEGMDCGPESMSLFRDAVLASKTVVWNGPAGVFEFDNFSKGTKSLLEAVAELTQKGGRGIIGGGDSATAAAKWAMEDKVHFVSTGGGASLELLEGKVLPGIAALDDQPSGSPYEGQPIVCKAMVAFGVNDLREEEIVVAPPKEGEVRVKVVCNALCHTDIYTLSGADPEGLFPSILGHEAGSIVESVGPGVTSVKPGDHVVPGYTPQCKRPSCIFCMSPKTNLCPTIRGTQGKGVMPDGTSRFTLKKDGSIIYHFMGCSTFAEYTVLAEISCAKVNPAADLSTACLFGCGVATGLGAVWNTAKVEPFSSVAVFGLGAVGLAVVQGAKAVGATCIVGIDTNPKKYEVAKQLGCTGFFNPKDYDRPIQQVLIENSPTKFGFDYTFDCTGNTEVMRSALEAAHRGWGQSCVIGVAAAGKELGTRPFQLITGRRWFGTAFGGWKTRDAIPALVERNLKGELQLDHFITHTFNGVAGQKQAIEALHSGDCLRALVRY